MSDPTILQLQRDLLTIGYDPGPLDGIKGKRTTAALTEYAKARGITAEEARSALHVEAEAKRAVPVPLPPNYVDLTDRCTNLLWRKCSRCHKPAGVCKHIGGPLPREWREITGVTLHQWGCPAAEAPERHLGLKAHYSITREGKIYRIHRETDFGWHAQGLSHHEIGIEFVGMFCGVEDDLKTRPGAPKSWKVQSLTPAQITAGRALIRYLHALVAYHGGKLTDVHAHRQGAPKDNPKQRRRGCPGSKVWKEIALVMMLELGLSDGGPGWTIGKGEPLPDVWTGREDGVPY